LEPVDIDKYEFARMPGRETWGLLVRRGSPLAEKTEIRSDDLMDLPILVSKRAALRKALSSWLGGAFEGLNIVATFNLINNAAIMVRKNMGVALCVERCDLFEDLRFIPLKPELTGRCVLAWKRNQMFAPATSAFLAFAKKCISSISDHTI
jgi:DNA-binding transcriptional LysR family regulator